MLIIASNYCIAQVKTNENYEKFIISFPSKISYPIELITNCKSVACLIKIDVDASKNIQSLTLSDSADSLFKVEFNKHKKDLYINLLEAFLKEDYRTNKCNTYLIPLFYTLYQMPCPEQTLTFSSLINYLKFNGDYIGKDVIILHPIYSKRHIQQ